MGKLRPNPSPPPSIPLLGGAGAGLPEGDALCRGGSRPLDAAVAAAAAAGDLSLPRDGIRSRRMLLLFSSPPSSSLLLLLDAEDSLATCACVRHDGWWMADGGGNSGTVRW